MKRHSQKPSFLVPGLYLVIDIQEGRRQHIPGFINDAHPALPFQHEESFVAGVGNVQRRNEA